MTEIWASILKQIEPKLDDFINEIGRVRGTVDKARTAANEGWRSINEMAGSTQGGGRWGG